MALDRLNGQQMREAMIGYRNGDISQTELASRAFETVRFLCHRAAMSKGADGDDVTQDVWLLFIEKIIPKYDENYDPLPFLYGFAKNVSLGMASRDASMPVLSMFEQEGEDGGHDVVIDRLMADVSEDLDETELVDKRIALGEIALRLGIQDSKSTRGTEVTDEIYIAGVKLGKDPIVRQGPVIPDDDAPAPKAKAKRTLTAEQQELVDIRNELGLSQPDFAAALSINVPCLSSYEYGRTQSVPKRVMDQARELRKNGNFAVAQAKSKYSNLTMPQILKQWASELSVSPDDKRTLALLLGTTETTISRWLEGNTRPPLQSIIRYDGRVKNELARRARTAEALQRLDS